MKIAKWTLVVLLSATVWAQTPAKTRKTTKSAPAVTAADIQALRDALAAQQQQIEQLRQEMQSRNQTLQQTQQQLQAAQAAASEAQQKLASMQNASDEQKQNYDRLQSDVADVKLNMTNNAVNTQEEQKRVSALEGLMGRFRFTGDIRVRQEDFFQDYTGCTTCVPRIRERIRVRLGIEGKLNEDFVGGLALASGTVVDPTSTNETLTSVFEKKTFALDRGYVTYQPQAHKWLQLTGGKFATTWTRTYQTFDPDLNPEGFSEKLSFDLHNPYFKNVTLTGLQLLFNEVSAPTAPTNANCVAGFQFCANGLNTSGVDSFAVGGQLSTRIKVAKRVTMTPSYLVLNWRNEDTILNQPPSVTGSTGVTVVPGTSPNSPPNVTLSNTAFAPNGLTNATVRVGTSPNGAPILAFLSRFLYGDAILNTAIDTGYARWPVNVTLEYLTNMRAKRVSPVLGRQAHLYKAEAAFGQQKNRGDWQFSYGWWRQEQDSVLGAFNESDQRAPTNILQHELVAQYAVRHNVTAGYTLWVGRTLNSNLQNARLAPGFKPGGVEPYLKRMQFDVVYKF